MRAHRAAAGAMVTMLAIAPNAYAIERGDDVESASELHAVATAVAAIQRDLATRCENEIGAAQFELCRQYDESIATWRPAELVRDALEAAMSETSADAETRIRIDARDYAGYAVVQLDEHIAHLAQTLFAGGPVPDWQIRDQIRLARQARVVVERLSLRGT